MIKRKIGHLESVVCHSGLNNMNFWGICCESGKHYAQVVEQSFRITMAALDLKSRKYDDTENVALMVIRDGIEYLLCNLKRGGTRQQQSLDLVFAKGANVTFYIDGPGKVYLTGYQLANPECDVLKCPVKAMSEGGSVEKQLYTSFLNQYTGEDDEDDSDYSADDQQSASDSDEESDGDSDNGSEEDSSEEQINQNNNESRKRKNEMEVLDQKRSRVSFKNTSTPMGNSKNAIALTVEDNDSDDKDDCLPETPSFARTPVPKEKITNEAGSSKKESKKKKRASEISNNSSVLKNTPTKRMYPIQKLAGGLEVQDIVVGKGPEAIHGKLLHVFYIGRLPDKSIFDSRLSPDKPFSFRLGNGQVIKGWDIGLVGMKVGGKRRVKIPPELAYGRKGTEGIPASTTLYFIVELNSVS